MKKLIILLLSISSLINAQRISDLPSVTSLADTDIGLFVSSGTTSNITVANLKIALGISITGTNTPYGEDALGSIFTGSRNSAFGFEALTGQTIGNDNIGIGYRALFANTSGSSNIGIGANAGALCINGSGSIFLGHNVQGANISNQLWVDNSNTSSPLLHGFFDTDSLVVNGDLYVTGSTNISAGTSNWTLNAGELYPNQASYDVVIGAAGNHPTNPKLYVNGASFMEDDLIVSGGDIYGDALSAGSGALITSFNNDNTLSANSATQSVTQQAVKGYVDSRWTRSGNYLYNTNDSIGINKTVPTCELDITGKLNVQGWAQFIDSIKVGTSSTVITEYKVDVDTLTLGGTDFVAADLGGGVSFGTDNQIPFTNSTSDDFDYNVAFEFDGTRLSVPSSNGTNFGFNAGNSASDGTNTAIGRGALNSGTVGFQNTALGRDANSNSSFSGDDNVTIGYESMETASSADDNIAIGSFSGDGITTGDRNTIIGTRATWNIGGSGLVTGSGNVVIGADAGRNIGNSTSNRLIIDNSDTSNPLVDGDFSANTFKINGIIINDMLSGSLTDGSPTDAEIDTVTGTTPSTIGSGAQYLISDSDGAGGLYKIYSDGTNWFYEQLTQAL